MDDEQLYVVDILEYLGFTLTNDGHSFTEVTIRIAIATSTMSKFTKIPRMAKQRHQLHCFTIKMCPFKSLVISIPLCGCESWTFLQEQMLQAASCHFLNPKED